MKPALLLIACNDARGCFTGSAEALRLGSIELEARFSPAPELVEHSGPPEISLAGTTWPCCGVVAGVGSLAWTGYTLGNPSRRIWAMPTLVRLLRKLRELRLYDMTTGPTPLFEWWHGEREASDAELHTWISDALED